MSDPMTTDHRTVVEFVDHGPRRMHKTHEVRVNGSPVTVAVGGISVTNPSGENPLRVMLTLLPDELHYVHDAETPLPTPPAAPVAAQEPDQAPVDPEGDDRRHTATTTDILDKDLRSALGRKAQRAARASQDATVPQKGAGRIGWLRLDPTYRFRYLAREVEGGWSDTDRDVRRWIDTGRPNAVFTPLLDGFFVAPDPDSVGLPAIWHETDDGPVGAMRRAPFNADFFDAVAGLLETREEA